MKLRRVFAIAALVLLPFVLAAAAVVGVLFARQGGFAPYRVPHGGGRAVAGDAATIARGEYLARLGDCVACHTTRGGAPLAGGRAFATGIGTVYSSNLTPDRDHGIGDWSADEFAHAMRHGVARRGPLYPVFPYAHFAGVSDADLDAIYAWLRAQPASDFVPPPNRLEAPADSRRALIGWRMLYYRPDQTAPLDPSDRGRYLVEGLGHCAMCHSARGERGSLPPEGHFAGGVIPGVGWYAPPLDSVQLQRYSEQQLADYLRDGTSPHGSAYGPMAEVAYASLRWLTSEDALAIARHLKQIAPSPLRPQPTAVAAQTDASGKGADVYARACADCHGKNGEGENGAYPPLRDAVAVTAPDPINAVRMVLYGGMEVTTTGNPRPHSMPPFVQQLDSAEVAAVVNHIRRTWGGQDSRLTDDDVDAMHGIVID
ncbi:cytochrome c [Dokdonella sp.]|uniref:cytochrome c n=1 Tax=Dokdonella sp. TaxID=2291710 RepID=UPI001B03772A|nr:cytochrome c [Dokdonella sp.]MBO9664414.1 c-type cytochrome [Dokdonella sp.]